jgi:alginate O-acetyltransferase complex protein AlgI
MLFHTQGFALFFFICLLGYWLIQAHRWRMLWLLTASVVFYMHEGPRLDLFAIPWPWGSGQKTVSFAWHILLILGSASIDYSVALRLERVARPRLRALLLVLSIACNLGLLFYFKYRNFFLDSLDQALAPWGVSTQSTRLDLILPLGISFYTFETISYIVDVYLGKVKPVRSLLNYALYIMFFPHLIAGPIVRARDFLHQLDRPKQFRWQRLAGGSWLFLLGLFKKAVVADHLATFVDPVFAHPDQFGAGAIWLGVLGYSFQIYCDFSGYTDMARGLAQTLGFNLPLNFRLPYLAGDISEFWQRWHISLSTWLRDYVYIPLGGSRGGSWRTCRNLFLTMLLGGLWHGAKWTMVVWGAYHGLLLILHRVLPWPRVLASKAGRLVCMAGTFLLVSVGWVFFRADSLAAAGLILRRMFTFEAGPAFTNVLEVTALVNLALCALYFLAAPIFRRLRLDRRLPAGVQGAALGLLFALALLFTPEGQQAFIYFQF